MVAVKIRDSLKKFIHMESSSGILLLLASLVAILFANSPLSYYYNDLLLQPVHITVGSLVIEKNLSLFINDGLMAVFFLLVSLEIKREVLEGHLSKREQQILPLAAALGGIVVPSLCYVLVNKGHVFYGVETINGWAIPAATDIAFALGIMALLGKRVPISLKVFLTALAILDDLAAILIIAIFYSGDLSVVSLLLASVFILCLIILNLNNVTKKAPYFVFGFLLWLCVLKSGIHATLAGVILGLTIPLNLKDKNGESPLKSLEHSLHPWTAFLILPIFAFANAGVNLDGISFSQLFDKVPLGIILGLFVGKQVGVFFAVKLVVSLKLAKMPERADWLSIYGVALLTGIGFTMSIFIANLAFPYQDVIINEARLGILVGSFLSAVTGYIALRVATRPK